MLRGVLLAFFRNNLQFHLISRDTCWKFFGFGNKWINTCNTVHFISIYIVHK